MTRQPSRLIALTGLGLVMAALFASAATSQATGMYTAEVDPTSVVAGGSDTFTVTLRNVSGGLEVLGSAEISVAAGFSDISAGTPNVSGWASAVNGNVVQLTSSSGNEVGASGEVSVDITATAPTSAGPNTWTTEAKESTDFTGTANLQLSGDDPVVTVTPGPLDHFTVSNPGTQAAGTSFDVTVTAEDAFGNPASGWTDTDGCVIFSGPLNSPPPGEVSPSYPAGGACTHPDASELSFDASGQATAEMTLFRATTALTVPSTTELTVTDTGPPPNETGSSGTFTVNPGSLFRFGWTDQPNAAQTAGVTFDRVEATAYDQWDNIKTDYDFSSAAFSGLNPSPSGCASDNTTVTPGGAFPCNPIYGLSGPNGIAVSLTTKDYKAESASLTVTDGSISESSSSFTVASAPLDHFNVPNPGTRVAGASFNQTVTALDAFGNPANGWTSTNGCVLFSGPLNSPPPSATSPSYPAPGPCFGTHPDSSQLSFDSSGQATASVTLFRATTALTSPSSTDLTVKDALTQTKQGATGSFTVDPGLLGYFTIANIVGQTAGAPFSVSATAFDQWDNLKTNYTGGAALGGTLSPSARGCGTGDTLPCPPSYGAFGPWTNGVASANVTAFKAETGRTITATDPNGGNPKTGTSNTFDVAPNIATAPPTRFSLQPTLTERLQIINDPVGVQVTVEDFWGNPRSGDNVTVDLDTHPSGDTLTGTLTRITVAGVATFDDLTIANSGLGYTLTATTGSASTTSIAFDIANDVNPCQGTCTATGSTGTVSATTTASGLGSGALANRLGPAAAAAPGDARLGMTVNTSVQVPAGVCGTGTTPFQQLGDGFGVSTVQAGGNQPSFRVVATLDKAVVRLKPGNPGANKFDICLGAFNVTNPPPGTGCSSATSSKSWLTKNGTCAVLDGGFYWGLLADYPSKVKNCPTAPDSNLFPGVLSKMKTNAGDVVITFCVPYPWDEKGGFG